MRIDGYVVAVLGGIALGVGTLGCSNSSVDVDGGPDVGDGGAFGDGGADPDLGLSLQPPVDITADCQVVIDTPAQTKLDQPNTTYCIGALTGAATFEFDADNVTLDGWGKNVTLTADFNLLNRTGVRIQNMKISGGVRIQGGHGNKVIHSAFKTLFICRSDDNEIYGNTIAAGAGGARVVRVHGYGLATDGEFVGDCGGPEVYATGNVIQGNDVSSGAGFDMRFLQTFFAKKIRFLDNHVVMESGGNITQLHYSDENTFEGNYFDARYPATFAGGEEWFGFVIRDGGDANRIARNEFHSNGVYSFLLNQPGNGAPFGRDNVVTHNRIVLRTGSQNQSAFRHMTTAGNERIEANVIYADRAPQGAADIGTANMGQMTFVTGNTIYAKSGVAYMAQNLFMSPPQSAYGTLNLTGNVLYSEDDYALQSNPNWNFVNMGNLLHSKTETPPYNYAGGSDFGVVAGTPVFANAAALDFVVTAPVGFGAPDVEMPSRPTGVTVSNGTVSWTASTDNVGVVDYELYSLGPSGPALNGRVTATAVTVELMPGKRYLFFVRARDAADNRSRWSQIAEVAAPP